MNTGLTIPDSVDNAVKNLSDKPTQAIGQTFADLWELALGGRITYAVERKRLQYAHDLEEFRNTLEAKINAIPENKQTEPPMQIAAQALEDSKYCIEAEELREMFSNLISRAMHADYSNKLHPSFSKIAQQLSPLDAQMLSLINKKKDYGGIAIVDYNKKKSGSGYNALLEGIPEVMPENCSPENAARSISSLQRLGLVEIPDGLHFVSESRYDVFKETALHEKLTADATFWGYQLDIKKRICKLTILGKDFASVCLD